MLCAPRHFLEGGPLELRHIQATSLPHSTGPRDRGFQRSRSLTSVFLGAEPYPSALLLLALTHIWNAEGQIYAK